MINFTHLSILFKTLIIRPSVSVANQGFEDSLAVWFNVALSLVQLRPHPVGVHCSQAHCEDGVAPREAVR